MEHFYKKIYKNMFDECCAQYYIDKVTNAQSGSKFVEIGSFTGASLSILVVENVNQEKQLEICAIDPWSTDWYISPASFVKSNGDDILAIFIMSFKLHGTPDGAFKFIRDFSYNAVHIFEDNSLDFVFIDGSHEYEDVKKDIEQWLPKVKVGGILAGHDLQYGPVKQAVTELLPNYTQKCDHIWEITKNA